ncbi:general transcriptional corepressor trfA isoform X5 [Drosophila novamexicana]|uniref:general transcriptional corepressor trfA isoform X5 n=1 Tax=Drosophila novamexicana TaxID=47314 RepID=UPI0011E60694|nr:general transcriptional corepressor trfA isoform X5 [Drosophila novamexicana]
MAADATAVGAAAAATTTTTTGDSPQSSPGQQLNSSVDSGIVVPEMDTQALKLRQRLQQCQRILQLLQRDQPTYQQLRDRLSKIAVKKKKANASSEQHSCNVCCADLDLSSAKNYVTCCTCGKHVCRGIKCADWLPKAAQWVCELCHSSKQSLEQTSSWVAEQMSFNQQKFVYPLRARSEIYIPISAEMADSSMHFESVSQVGANSATLMNMDERSRIREYVEEIVAEMLGGNLDHIKVGQLSKSENYLPAIVNGNNNNSSSNSNNNNINNEQLADISQTRLRSLIETIIAETLRSGSNSILLNSPSGAVSEISLDTRSNGQLSGFSNGGSSSKRRHRTEHYFEPKIYQDLLATAVLNKIADKEGNNRLISESTPDLSAHNIDENYNAEALSTTSGSSIEPRSDCSLTDHELTGKAEAHAGSQLDVERESVLSDYIAAHMVPLPDFSASVTESEDDVVSMSSSLVGDGTWEDNWLFKKKRSTLQSSATPSSIGMLVPAPKENIRAQIGDRTADEVSDLSEMGSDAEETSLDLLRCNELNDRLLSKHLIGGQNTKLVLDELVDRTSLTSNTLPAEHEPAFTETTNPLVQQPTAATAPQSEEQKTSNVMAPPPPMIFQDDENTEDPAQTLIAGSIAEREVRKWSNAVEMPNNPYAPEALKQRISGTQERFMDVPNISACAEQKALALMRGSDEEPASRVEDYKRYSRDYYINNAPQVTTPTSARAASVACSSTEEPASAQTDEDIVINEAKIACKTAVEQTQEQLVEMPDDKCIYTALPAQVLEDGCNASLETQSNQSLQTTSDDSDTVRVYDFNKQETTVIKAQEQPPSTSSTSSMESALSAPSSSSSIDASRKRERPVVLQFGPADATPNVCASPSMTPTRGSTPPAFRFLQPKRRLIEPSQVLSIDDDDEMPEPAATPTEKPAVEDDVVHALPSVKALAQAFLLTSKRTQPERRWRAKTLQHAKLRAQADAPEQPTSPQPRKHMLQHAVSIAEVADESTIASDLSSLETDPSMQSEENAINIPIASPASPVPVRRGFLRSNIAYFENLKFK